MSLRDTFNEYLVKGQQGQLVIKFASDVHLCKILIEDGKAVHITHGRSEPELILQSLPSKTVEWVNFIAGYPVRKFLDIPLHELLVKIGLGQLRSHSVATPPPPAGEVSLPKASPPTQNPDIGGNVPAQKIKEAIGVLTEKIGPMGGFIAEQTCQFLGYSEGSSMNETMFNEFVATLARELPKDIQAAFLKKYQV